MSDTESGAGASPKASSRLEIDIQKPVKQIGRCFEVQKKGPSNQKIIIHYYIELLDEGTMALEMVDDDGEPTGQLIDRVSREEFTRWFKTCSQHECSLQPKAVEEIAKKMAENRVAMGERHLERDELNQAEDKFKRALTFDEENVRASFGLGKTLIEKKKIDEAMELFRKISESNIIYEQANKHTFNEFGIYLRKKELYDLAIDNYGKAISIDSEDVALYYNLGRAYREKGEFHRAIDTMKEGLAFAEEQKNRPEKDQEFLASVIKETKELLDLYIQQEREYLDGLLKD